MAVLRNGRYTRKASDAEARAMQEAQAQAAIRKIARRLYQTDPQSQWATFLLACLADIRQVETVAA